jgi:hypothetical protein
MTTGTGPSAVDVVAGVVAVGAVMSNLRVVQGVESRYISTDT